MNNKKLVKLEIKLLKTMPMLLAFVFFLNIVFSYLGINTEILSILCLIIPLIFIYVSSYCFKFCGYHRMFLHYILVSEAINWYDYKIGIPIENRSMIGIQLIVVAIFIFVILYMKLKT